MPDTEAAQSDQNQEDDSPESLTEVLQQMKENTEGDQISLGDVLDALDSRSFGPLLLVPAILAVSPIGAIPGMSIATGLVLLLVSVQMLVSSGRPWLPKRLLNFSFSRETFAQGIDKTLPWAKWLEKFTARRLTFLTTAPFYYVLAIIIALLAILFIPLALLPFAVSIPGLAVALFALGITVEDGVMVLLGLAIAGVAVGVTYFFWPF
ncbi:exopolysaccharide biosynthesis protein [Bremerella cremea]|uniref:exopolysaccharide biosynthesis protein n=1 Tax=Bremerella cremea TaxID=1031537 RepID=UPI0031E4FD58